MSKTLGGALFAVSADAQSQLEQAQTDHDKSLSDARLATTAAQQHAAEVSARSAAAHQAHARYLERLVSRHVLEMLMYFVHIFLPIKHILVIQEVC